MGVETNLRTSHTRATPAMPHDSALAVPYPAVSRKKVTAAFDGGRLSSDSGVMRLGIAEQRRGLAKTLAALIADLRSGAHHSHG